MKNQVPVKLFKRKTSSLKSLQVDLKRETEFLEGSTKFLSPRNIKGLDEGRYRKEEAVVRGLQEDINRLRDKVGKLVKENSQLRDQNEELRGESKRLRQQMEEHDEQQKRSRTQHYATVEALNELKQKIDSLSDDHLSTVDEIPFEDLCHCHKYQQQLTQTREKVRFLEESLLHSQEIIMRLQEEIKKIRVSKTESVLGALEINKNKGLRKVSVRQKGKGGGRMNSIEEIAEVNQE